MWHEHKFKRKTANSAVQTHSTIETMNTGSQTTITLSPLSNQQDLKDYGDELYRLRMKHKAKVRQLMEEIEETQNFQKLQIVRFHERIRELQTQLDG